MNRNIESVKGLYEEWYVGVGDVPSIDFLESEYGPNWHKAEKDRVWFFMGKNVICLVHDLVEQNNISRESAIKLLDEYRNKNSATLNWLAQHMKDVLAHLK